MDINQNLSNLMKEAQKMQERMQEAQQQLTQLVVDGAAGGGLVKIEMNGRHEVSKVVINPSLIDEDDIGQLEVLIASAINNAVSKVEKASKEKISQLTAGLNIPKDFMKNDGEGKE